MGQAAFDLDAPTLLAANGVILLVMATAFFTAWLGQRDFRYWLTWTAANVVLASAVLILMVMLQRGPGPAIFVPNCLLALGFALRWLAARQFAGRSGPAAVLIAAPAVMALPYLFRPVLGYEGVFVLASAVLAAWPAAVAWEFWRDRRVELLPSRHGLVAAYALLAVAYAVRVVMGLRLAPDIANLAQDPSFALHLLVAVVHTVASGAFVLSIAYERNAIGLREAALRDPLTGLHNRRAFEARIRGFLSRGGAREFALVLLDLDRFKSINDGHGHAAGDEALRSCAALLGGAVRPGDFVARIGGEEFALLLPDISGDGAFELSERIRRKMAMREVVSGESRFGLTVSAGVYHGRAGAVDFDAIMRLADEGLYAAKKAGRDRVTLAAHAVAAA